MIAGSLVMYFLADSGFPPALARSLTEHGHAVGLIVDCGLEAASDRGIRGHARNAGLVITP